MSAGNPKTGDKLDRLDFDRCWTAAFQWGVDAALRTRWKPWRRKQLVVRSSYKAHWAAEAYYAELRRLSS